MCMGLVKGAALSINGNIQTKQPLLKLALQHLCLKNICETWLLCLVSATDLFKTLCANPHTNEAVVLTSHCSQHCTVRHHTCTLYSVHFYIVQCTLVPCTVYTCTYKTRGSSEHSSQHYSVVSLPDTLKSVLRSILGTSLHLKLTLHKSALCTPSVTSPHEALKQRWAPCFSASALPPPLNYFLEK